MTENADAFSRWLKNDLTPGERVVILMTEALYNNMPPRRWWQRKVSRLDCLLTARAMVVDIFTDSAACTTIVDYMTERSGR